MLDRYYQNVLSLLFGCVTCLVLASVVNADGQLFVLDQRNSSGLLGFQDAERACASRHARLASAEELRHAVVDCFFSPCTRGWLYGGEVGTTVCNVVGSALKAVDVRTENATEDAAHLGAFCIKDKGTPCGDPPSFPNARLQGHAGFEMGDELLYTCLPGYMMPSGQNAFSLVCDSCGEWYGLVQMCVKDENESHVDYEDKFTDSYGEVEDHSKDKRPEEANRKAYEAHVAVLPGGEKIQEHSDAMFNVKEEEEHQDDHGEQEDQGEGIEYSSKVRETAHGQEQAEEETVEDFIGHQRWEQERRPVVRTDEAAATEAPVSLLSQKHLFWFPSEAFQEEGRPLSTNSATQTTQRASGGQSEESKEHDSKEKHHQHSVEFDDRDHEQDRYDDHNDHINNRHHNQDRDDSHHDDHDDRDNQDSHQDEDDDHESHYRPAQHDLNLNTRDRYEDHDDHDDHYDMGEHEDDRDHVRYGGHEYDDQVDNYDEHESYEDHEDVTDDHRDREHPDASEEHPDNNDHDDVDGHYDDEDDTDRFSDHHDRDDHDDHDNYDDHDSHEDDDHHHVIFSIAHDRKNITQKVAGGETATTDETWLDGYPIVHKETDTTETTEKARPENKERGTAVRTTDRPNEVEVRKPFPYTKQPEDSKSPTTEPELEQEGVDQAQPGIVPTATSSIDPSDTPSYSDTLDYDTQQAAPTNSWLDDLTEHPFLDHGPAPPLNDIDVIAGTGFVEEHTVHNLPGETGERGEVEGEMGETICVDESCPPRPPSSSGRGPTIAAIIAAVCVVAVAVIVGVWCYRRQLNKSSVYEMNGKGQSQTRQGQQIEMQQKV
ncbi:sushi domain-containing protein 5 [Sphaeramia orbicularis]|uniref:sushi domain-containing protein 5 n=1 Tax=Sphaeramia orbicularis TaxID=375764 RepID=UPI00117C21D6|nr:sushi domain-containing protein 5 [Sphaeramia orbicularis]